VSTCAAPWRWLARNLVVDPQGSTAAEIAITRSIQLGNQVEGITGGLEVEIEQDESQNPD
jgi:hypothetical protein